MISLGFTGRLLTTQSEWPNKRATRLASYPAPIMPRILPLSNCDSSLYGPLKRRHEETSLMLCTMSYFNQMKPSLTLKPSHNKLTSQHNDT
ncbi:hypothetical protein TNCV_1725211 [Trichonephila clavipes]|nr:hypothetical protein TNCV_1725211 [Trichonephila clavipes]